ncbi:hypothetical protein ID47_00740 [Candidatus Paracaedibacter acanthamoebae]|uniref:Uncharacterized protein n=2 Tax=Candidatus Odyssella acanthamoebae TaxID=91604 RepID=A0A077AVC7_9PROT|nr:hypothetical protein ID47_00740 [Candidatus Paracaedibacter acanthamoebae]
MDIERPLDAQNVKFVQDQYSHYLALSQQNTIGKDVHAVNEAMNMRQTLMELQKVDARYIPATKNIGLDVLANILLTPEFLGLTPQGQQSVHYNINKLKEHIKINPVETKETGAHIPQLLARLWDLSHFKEPRSADIFFPTSSATRAFLIDIVRENSETGGGCYAGLRRPICLPLFNAH